MKAMTGILAVLAVYVPNQLHFPDSLGIRGLNVFNLLLIVALVILLATRGAERQEPSPRAPLTRPLLIYYAVLGIALLVSLAGGSPHPLADITVYKTVVTYSLLYFLAYYGVRDLVEVRKLVAVIVFVFAVASVEAFREGLDYGLGNFSHGRRAAGPFSEDSSNANFAGVFYGIFASFSLAVALLGRSLPKILRIAAAGAFALGVIAILATFSRQSFLIIGVTVLLLALRRNILLAFVALALILNYSWWAPAGVIKRIEMTQETNEYGQAELEDSAESRYVLWAAAIDIIKDHPEGIGLNQFKRVVDPYMPSWVTARDAQNQYLLVAAEAGLLGLAAFLLLLGALLLQGLRLARATGPPEAHAIGVAFAVAAIAVVLGNIYSSTFHHGEVMGNVWMLAGLVSRYRMLQAQDESAPTRPATPIDRIRQVHARWQARPSGKGSPGA